MFKIISILFFCLFFSNTYSSEQFNFDVTEIEIVDNGNKFIGSKRGIITSNNGLEIEANQFEYDKSLNILIATENVKINDKINNYKIYTEKLIYNKNDELIFTKKNSKGVNLIDNIIITAENFEYNKNLNTLSASQNVIIVDKKNNYKIYSEFISYQKNEEKIFTEGKTLVLVDTKYKFESEDVLLLRDAMELISKKKTTITDKSNLYNLSKFKYFINEEKLVGEKILISSNYNLPENDKIYFSNGIINLKTQNFVAKDTEIRIHKDIFDNSENDPRLKGVSSRKDGDITIVNKGIFTSCKENDTCPPWSIQAEEIKHDKNKKVLNYKNAFLKLYDIPVLYFPKFFHPDPTVERQSGILKPVLNNSNVLGSSFILPYYHVISEDSDLTFAPLIFDKNTKMIQNEFRKIGKNYNFIANFGHTRKYKSTLLNKNKNISYLFSTFEADLEIENFNSSKMLLNVEKVTNDTFLKIFDTNLIDDTTSLNPKNQNSLSSEVKFIFNHDDFDLTTGFQSFEDLQLRNNDRYEYILPYYDLNKTLFQDFNKGSFNFSSRGSNELKNTNQLKSQIINDLSYSSLNYISAKGIKNNFNLALKNLNSVGKNLSAYKSSPQVELSSILEYKSSIPLKKISENYSNFLTPKLSFRVNPGDMKNYNSDDRTINTENIFSLDRLGLDNSLESGRSLTLGVDYRKERIEDINKFFEFKLATVLRDKEEDFIPLNTTLNKKNSNIFGSITNNYSENLKLDYKFAIDNNLNEIQYNDINTTFTVNNLVTSFHFIKEIGEMGDQNLIENQTSYKIDENNFVSFNTRRNRKLNLTEFYDLVYEYKNDCLIAGIRYQKKYYEDRDLKPTEDLFFSITLFPLTTYEQKVDQLK